MNYKKWLFPGLSFILMLFFLACYSNVQDSTNADRKLQLVTDKIHSPVTMAIPGDGSGRIFICQKEGKIWIIDHGKVLPQPFLDVSSKMIDINPGYDERGLLGLAFSPNFRQDKKFYIYYSVPSNDPHANYRNILSSFTVSGNDPNKANDRSEQEIMQFQKNEVGS